LRILGSPQGIGGISGVRGHKVAAKVTGYSRGHQGTVKVNKKRDCNEVKMGTGMM